MSCAGGIASAGARTLGWLAGAGVAAAGTMTVSIDGGCGGATGFATAGAAAGTAIGDTEVVARAAGTSAGATGVMAAAFGATGATVKGFAAGGGVSRATDVPVAGGVTDGFAAAAAGVTGFTAGGVAAVAAGAAGLAAVGVFFADPGCGTAAGFFAGAGWLAAGGRLVTFGFGGGPKKSSKTPCALAGPASNNATIAKTMRTLNILMTFGSSPENANLTAYRPPSRHKHGANWTMASDPVERHGVDSNFSC